MEYIPRSEIAGSHGNSVFTFWGTARLISKEAVLFCIPTSSGWGLWFLHASAPGRVTATPGSTDSLPGSVQDTSRTRALGGVDAHLWGLAWEHVLWRSYRRHLRIPHKCLMLLARVSKWRNWVTRLTRGSAEAARLSQTKRPGLAGSTWGLCLRPDVWRSKPKIRSGKSRSERLERQSGGGGQTYGEKP